MPLRRPKRKAAFLVAGLAGGLGAAAAYAALFFLSGGITPIEELRDPLRSPLVAACADYATVKGIAAVFDERQKDAVSPC